jgi:hypothetical protein
MGPPMIRTYLIASATIIASAIAPTSLRLGLGFLVSAVIIDVIVWIIHHEDM